MHIKQFIIRTVKRIILKYRAGSQEYVEYLKKCGVTCGENITIYSPNRTTIDITRPFLLSIGSNVIMTGPVTILTHDYSTTVCSKKYIEDQAVENIQTTTIGNNVFLGWGCTILGGTIIQDNTIIGAGSVASGILEGDSVYAGIPARRIMSIEEYYNKRKSVQLDEAVTIYKRYYKWKGIEAPEEIYGCYSYLWEKKNERMKDQATMFKNYGDFCNYAKASFDDNVE